MKKRCIGIDPGKGGGIAVMSNGNIITVTTMILATDKKIDLTSMSEWIVAAIDGGSAIACIEGVASMPGQGVSSMFSFGYSVGAIHGILAALGIPRHIVSPQKWQRSVLGRNTKDKNVAIDYCRRVYPNVSLLPTERSRKPHNGIADAICICQYAYNNL